ncbi:hypothetical protein Nans01_24150 [Nocardiopsis ansamitocini]|uniref:HTH luxR-type domain-containing protein n=1 Tax=Nocardiopsis ansamitocini TaxID=1670832 RepID=A0A9W6UIT2_9ACTN|nr:hypothetical protein Nans01_24150 [Nocardiopsis ansamitocini]
MPVTTGADTAMLASRYDPIGPREPDRSPSSGAAALSDREREVAALVGTGATNRDIASGLFITQGTVKNHISSVLRKLGLRDRTQLAVWVSSQRAR